MLYTAIIVNLFFWSEPLKDKVFNYRFEKPPYIVEIFFDLNKLDNSYKWATFFPFDGPFKPTNKGSFMRLYNKATKNLIFEATVPLLTYVCITNDKKYIVGCSKISDRNPFKVVIYDIKGQLLWKDKIEEGNTYTPNFTASSTYICWFNQWEPNIQVHEEKGRLTAISFLDLAGERFKIPIP